MLALLDTVFDRTRRGRLRDGPLALFLLAPALAILSVFGIAPLFYAVWLSFHRTRGDTQTFVGLANYAEALLGRFGEGVPSIAFQENPFWNSFFVTLFFALGTVPAALALSFLVANSLFRVVRFRGTLRTLYFLPYVTSVVAAATVWRQLLNPTTGVANEILSWLHLPAQTWLLQPRGILHLLTDGRIPHEVGPSLALCCVMFFDIWHTSGFMIVVFLAGLSALPRELEDAARLDGASGRQLAWKVTLPLLSPTVFFLAIVSFIKSFQSFSSFYSLTGDGRGPLDTTQNMTVYIYTNLYEYQRLGYGAAVATLLCAAIVVLTLVQWRFVGRKVFYQ